MALREKLRRRWFAVALILLGLQVTLIFYSFSNNARKIFYLNGNDAPGYRVGVSKARWAWMNLRPSPPIASAPEIFDSHMLGLRYLGMQNVLSAVTIHFTWTIIPNLLLLVWTRPRRGISLSLPGFEPVPG